MHGRSLRLCFLSSVPSCWLASWLQTSKILMMIGIASTSSSVKTTVSIKRFAIITAIVSNDYRFFMQAQFNTHSTEWCFSVVASHASSMELSASFLAIVTIETNKKLLYEFQTAYCARNPFQPKYFKGKFSKPILHKFFILSHATQSF